MVGRIRRAAIVTGVLLASSAFLTPNGSGTPAPPDDLRFRCAAHLVISPECTTPAGYEARHWQMMRLRDAAVAEAARAAQWRAERVCLWDVIVVDDGRIREVCVGWSR